MKGLAVSVMFMTFWTSVTVVKAQETSPEIAPIFVSCAKCHGDKGEGNAETKAPKLAGQFDWYTQSQLLAFKSATRKYKNGATCATGLSEKDVTDLSAHIKGL